MEKAVIETVEAGHMTKDLAICVHGWNVTEDQYLMTEAFMDEIKVIMFRYVYILRRPLLVEELPSPFPLPFVVLISTPLFRDWMFRCGVVWTANRSLYANHVVVLYLSYLASN